MPTRTDQLAFPRPEPGRILIAPSILAADFARLADEVQAAEAAGADVIHVDVMDGQFVPNLTVGPAVVRSLRSVTRLPLDVHLMVRHPEKFVDAFADAGADSLTVHVETGVRVGQVLDTIRQCGCAPGISLRPATPAAALFPYLERVQIVLVMTVEPGFGGQAFMPEMLEKITAVRRRLAADRLAVFVEVDGGIAPGTAGRCVAAGADLLVAGTSVFRAPGGIAAAVRHLRADAGPAPSPV